MTGYVRKDTTNNIADGNVINAADLDAEFDGVQDAFNASTGHNHDGTTGEGAPITALGPTQDVTISAILLAPKTNNTVDIGSSSLKFKDLFLAGNGSIGGTLAVTGVATLTANPVFSGGTANGVAYLNGSKVVTSGSALTFDGTNFGVNATPTNYGAGYRTFAINGSSSGAIEIQSAGTVNGLLVADNSDFQIQAIGAKPIRFFTNGNQRATIDSSGNLGIGTSSPSQKLHVVAAGGYNSTFSENSANKVRLQFYIDANETALVSGYDTTAKPMTFYTGGSLRATLDSSGNLGLGVTPTQAFANSRAIQIGSGGLIEGRTNESLTFSLASNAYLSAAGNWTYTTNNRASLFALTNGSYSFGIAPAGTGTITFTTAMTLDASGNLGIGTTSPTTRLSITDSTGPIVRLVRTSNRFELSADTDFMSLNARDASTYITFKTADTERARIDSSGNLGVGSTSPSTSLGGARGIVISGTADVQLRIQNSTSGSGATDGILLSTNSVLDGYLWNYENANFIFGTNNAERARITSAGNFGIGTSSPDEKLMVQAASGLAGVRIFDGTYSSYIATISSAGNYGNGSVAGQLYLRGQSGIGFSGNGGGSTQMTLDSSGNLLIGATAFQGNTPRLYVRTSSQGVSANNSIWVNDYAATASAAMHVWSFSQTTAPASGNFVDAYYNGVTTLAFRIAGNGNVTNINNSYGSTSDIKLKENIVDATPKLAGLMQVKIRNYNMIGDTTKQIGVVAQELETVFPAMVDESPDRDAEGNDLGTTTKSVKYSVFVPMLIKAMQEQQAIIESLKARLDAANL